MDVLDGFLFGEYIVVVSALAFAYFVLAPADDMDLNDAMAKMRQHAESQGIAMHEVELVMMNGTLKPKDGRYVSSKIEYDQVAGYAQYINNDSRIVMRGDFNRKLGTLAHEYAHQVMYAKGVWEGHHDMLEFWSWENYLYLRVATGI